MTTVYISIGNSDDKLTQERWSAFFAKTRSAVRLVADIHGEWASESTSAYQNACWCFELDEDRVPALRRHLSLLAAEFAQDSIAWAVAETEFIGPAS